VNTKKNLAVILAGGAGTRIGGDLPKQFMELEGKLILGHTLDRFELHPRVDDIFLVTNREYMDMTETFIKENGYRKVLKVLAGGKVRQDSSRVGVMAADASEYENILIHDAARPFISRSLIDTILDTLEKYRAVNVAIPSADTILEIDDAHLIRSVPDRNFLRRAQTPQSFKLDLIRQAHQLALQNNITDSSDDCLLISRLKLDTVFVVEGDPLNIKITYPMDMGIAEVIFRHFVYDNHGR